MKIKKFQARTFTEALAQVKKELSEDAIILSTEQKKGRIPMVEITAAVDYDMEPAKNENTIKALDAYVKMKRMQAAGKLAEPTAQSARNKVSQDEDETGMQPPASTGVRPPASTGVRPPASMGVRPPASMADSRPVVQPAVGPKKSADAARNKAAETFQVNREELQSMVKDLSQDIKGEIDTLRESIEEMKNQGFEMALPPKKRMLFYYLRERAIREEYALLLCEKAKKIEDVAPLMLSNIKVKEKETGRRAMMLIGPTGVGKTTTVAKLAANAIRQGKKAAVISLDTYRIGAVEQARIYSRIMGIPLSVVSDLKELEVSLRRFMDSRDIVFIDTTGRNPRDDDYIETISRVCSSDIPIELHLLMSANSDDEFMVEAYRQYRRLPVNFIAFTKVDEAVRFGSIYNLLLTYQKPVAYLTTGQKVPGDIDFAAADKLASLILRKECYKC
jgi:flagellar biosynthesis protein FlhF